MAVEDDLEGAGVAVVNESHQILVGEDQKVGVRLAEAFGGAEHQA